MVNYKRFKSHKEETINDIEVQVQSPMCMTMGGKHNDSETKDPNPKMSMFSLKQIDFEGSIEEEVHHY